MISLKPYRPPVKPAPPGNAQLNLKTNHALANPANVSQLLAITRLLNSSHRLEQQLGFIIKEVSRILDVEHTIFHLHNERRKELWSHFVWQKNLKQIKQNFGDGMVEQIILSGKVVNVPDVRREPRYRRSFQRFGATTIRSVLLVPIKNRSGKPTGCLQVINKREGMFDNKDTDALMIMADLIALAIQNSLNSEEALEARRLEAEISRAVDIQRQLLPNRVPRIPGYKMFAFNQPSKYVGGDYYDFFPFPRTLSFVLADVSGKGVPAALLTANLHASLHAIANEINTCKDVVRKINSHFHLYTASDMFATFFWANLNHHSHQFRYVNAGHVPPILIKRNGQVSKLRSGGLPIGIVDSFDHEEKEISLQAGDTLLIFSDGISEVMNKNGEMFGKEEMVALVKQHNRLSPQELGKVLLQRLRTFTGKSGYPDDMTLMILKRDVNS
ncbi:MAG TPA: SpoIIE family protein phosphatase [Calditrichia bacterium]|nr:SpoIIE family protein phosphatase [Calditrichota bacterium]HQU72447.1 SpoIIE family protein phosphatase [Calditrichia bacterium]HQV31855.1 SpoIIE family protein phosphatase [Calditrichia bacterium]